MITSIGNKDTAKKEEDELIKPVEDTDVLEKEEDVKI